jgi:hypothetical protein
MISINPPTLKVFSPKTLLMITPVHIYGYECLASVMMQVSMNLTQVMKAGP